ncbi:unnamed protein product [Cladocopium goreaui]|uniref:Uncharacterized protein n=1 Tax=Cladocopium goreaui TaxID=2562237 RepID=A0A9P1G0R7_9DINO|nr:unnamed protein product [Cladocopium goreaui]
MPHLSAPVLSAACNEAGHTALLVVLGGAKANPLRCCTAQVDKCLTLRRLRSLRRLRQCACDAVGNFWRRDIKAKCCERLALKVCGATSLADLTDEDC